MYKILVLFVIFVSRLSAEEEVCNIEDPGGEKENVLTFKLQHCKCDRTITVQTRQGCMANEDVKYEETTCSRDSFRRGPNQKVVSFSFYGDVKSEEHEYKQFFPGIERNLHVIKEKYPGWLMRLYFSPDIPKITKRELCKIACTNDHIDLCKMDELPGSNLNENEITQQVAGINLNIIGLPMVWRFLPTIDQQVSHFMSRDLDSMIIDREVAAVQEWLDQDQFPFHFMRDHYFHVHPIMGGMWGVQLNQEIRGKMIESFESALTDELITSQGDLYGTDQYLLYSKIYKWASNLALVHAAYNCDQFRNENGLTKAFPTKRKIERNNFVASLYSFMINEPILKVECPETCRPKEHADWIYC